MGNFTSKPSYVNYYHYMVHESAEKVRRGEQLDISTDPFNRSSTIIRAYHEICFDMDKGAHKNPYVDQEQLVDDCVDLHKYKYGNKAFSSAFDAYVKRMYTSS